MSSSKQKYKEKEDNSVEDNIPSQINKSNGNIPYLHLIFELLLGAYKTTYKTPGSWWIGIISELVNQVQDWQGDREGGWKLHLNVRDD